MLLIGAIVYGKTATNSRTCPPSTYNLLNLPETVTSGNTTMATYHWLADGTKYKVTDPAGNGVIYAGDLTYAVTVSGGNTAYALESAEASADGTARFLKNGTAMTPYYTIRDHLGSVRTIVNASGNVVERNDYYPFGSRTTFGASYATLASNRQKFSGKEDQTAVAGSTLPYLDFGARMYDAKLVRWSTYDPMAEKYYRINPYAYCNGDPVNLVDPEGKVFRKKTIGNTTYISATYWVSTHKEKQSAEQAVQIWNNRKDVYRDSEGNKHRIVYNLSVSYGHSKNGNTYSIVPKNSLSTAGETTGYYNLIKVREDYYLTNPQTQKVSSTGAHEIGHSF